jgi:hypothetical protein
MTDRQVDGVIAIDGREAASGITRRVHIRALPSGRQEVLVRIPAGTKNKTVMVLPGKGPGSPPGDLRVRVRVRHPVKSPRPEPAPWRPPDRPLEVAAPDRSRPLQPARRQLTGWPKTLTTLFIFVAFLALGPGLLAGGIISAGEPEPTVATCEGQVMDTTDQCIVTSVPGGSQTYTYDQMLARERSGHDTGPWVEIGVGAACSVLLGLLAYGYTRARRLRHDALR